MAQFRGRSMAMGRVTRASILLSAIAFVLLPSDVAVAQCATPPSLEDALAEASVAFIAQVETGGFDSIETTLRVLWIWKGGDLPSSVAIRADQGGTSADSSGFRFSPGATYIVIPENTAPPFVVGECSGTRRYRAEGDVVPAELQTAVGASRGRIPGQPLNGVSDDAGSDSRLPLVWSAFAFVMLVGGGMYLVARRAKRSVESAGDTTPDRRMSRVSRRRPKRSRSPLRSSGSSGQRRLARLRSKAKKT